MFCGEKRGDFNKKNMYTGVGIHRLLFVSYAIASVLNTSGLMSFPYILNWLHSVIVRKNYLLSTVIPVMSKKVKIIITYILLV